MIDLWRNRCYNLTVYIAIKDNERKKVFMKKQISFIAALIMIITTVFSGTVFAASSFYDVADDNRYT